MKSESEAISKSIDLGNLGVIAPHKAKYYDRYNMSWLIGAANAGMQLKYVTFWHEGDEYPNHYFSQWYQGKPFSVNGRTYITAEQYMMSEKALLFKDLYHYGLIMEESSPKKCKDLGRLVSGFDSSTWDNALREIIFHGNLDNSRVISLSWMLCWRRRMLSWWKPARMTESMVQDWLKTIC